jgi:glucose/mannose-6-phosphate isomerase
MNLNDTELFSKIDTQNIIDYINNLPDQLAEAWALGNAHAIPNWQGIKQVIIAGMGGSAIGGDLLSAYVSPLSTVPVFVHRNYQLPAWVNGEDTLVICSSHSGNTEEVLTVFHDAVERKCKILAITTGGKLEAGAKEAGAAIWKFVFDFQPRAAVGFSFGLLLAAFAKLGFIEDQSEQIADAVAEMKKQQQSFYPEVPDTQNPAKRLAGQFMNRWVTIWGAQFLAPVARRWKGQINELAKAQASFEELPEADHNALQGVPFPEDLSGKTMSLWLKAPGNHPRNQLREDFTRKIIMLEGYNSDFVLGVGDSILAQMWTVLHYGDYVSYYLAMSYHVDPTPVPILIDLKGKMASA